MKLLHLDASILGEGSVSRQASAAVVARLRALDPGLEVTYRDLAAEPLPHLTGAHLAGPQAAAGDPALQAEQALGAQVLDEFLAADTIVIGAPMYNFTVPSQLKAWIDRILVAGRTFRYTEAGPQGLAGDKRVIVAISRGGFYGPGTQNSPAEHLESYLGAVFGFVGIAAPEFIVAEGIALGPEQRRRALDGALQASRALAA